MYGFERNFINSETYFMLMHTNEKVGYLAPEVEVNEVEVEQGIAASNMESIGGENEEIGW